MKLINICISIIVLIIIFLILILVLTSFSKPFKECENRPDDYMVENFITDGEIKMISCGEINAINTSLMENRGVIE